MYNYVAESLWPVESCSPPHQAHNQWVILPGKEANFEALLHFEALLYFEVTLSKSSSGLIYVMHQCNRKQASVILQEEEKRA